MPFYVVKINGEEVRMHLKLSGKAPSPCRAPVQREGRTCYCMGIGSLLCDFPVGEATCDMPLCTEHGIEVGKDRHYCPKHKAEADSAAPELF